ncbi:hypothetical protein FA95DRAFT_1471542, partial [Auriscalpium vulgare]
MDLALPAGLPTHQHNVTKKWSRLDQVFITEHTYDHLLVCDTLPALQGPGTDHVPVSTKLDLHMSRRDAPPPPNFREVNWDEFKKALRTELAAIGAPHVISSEAEFNNMCLQVTSAMQRVIEQLVPRTQLSCFSRRWWSKELTMMRRFERKARRESYKFRDLPDHPSHAAYLLEKRDYGIAIERAKRLHFQDWLEKATDPDLWTANRYISRPAGD